MVQEQNEVVVWPLWLKAHRRALGMIEADLAGEDLPPLDWYDVLWTLEQAPQQRLRMAELADEVLLARSNMTRLVDRIEHAGLLRRELCSADRRGFYAVLTQEGQEIRRKMWPVYRASVVRVLEGTLSGEEREALRAVFSRILAQ